MRAYKTELDPNNKQATLFGQFAEARQFVYNIALREWKHQYENGGKPSEYSLRRQFNTAKHKFATFDPHFRNAVSAPYAVTEGAFKDLGAAFGNFFRRIKQGAKEPGHPKFSKRADRFAIRNIAVEIDRVRITNVGWVRLKERNYIPVSATYGTYAVISKCAGRWFISVLVKDEDNELGAQNNGPVLGIDFGLKSLAVLSDGTVYENPRPLCMAQLKLKRLQRELARRKKGGSNWHKTKRKLQRQHAKVADIRRHALHQISHDLVMNKHPSIIVLEDLNVSGMMKNHCLAQAISDVGFSELRRQIEYKASRNGTTVLFVDRWFPSSKACSGCGCLKDDLTLADRTYECEHCGLTIDRDLNAALNLAAIGERSNGAGLPVELGRGKAPL